VKRRLVGLVVFLLVAWGGLAATLSAGITPRLGLDLQGGVSVILTAPDGTDPELVEVAVEVMRRRIEAFGGVQEPEISVSGGTTVLVQLPGVETRERAIEAVGQTGSLSFHPVLLGPDDADSNRCSRDDPPSGEGIVTLPPADPTRETAHTVGKVCLRGEDVADAIPLFDPQAGSWVVQLDLAGAGAQRFADLTALAAGYPFGDPRRQIAIVLDEEIVTAPPVAQGVSPEVGITGGSAIITMGNRPDAQAQARDTAVVLRYGSLPVSFERSQVVNVSGTLGADSLRAGIIAGLLGLVLVAVVLLAMYRALGLVAIVGLTVFGSLLVTTFSLLGRYQGLTLTLAGVVGIIVAVGINADSYIVHFEAVKDEIRNGLEVVEAAEVGFKRAWRTILTADTVSLIGAALLWALAVGAVKGFALALGIATILDIIIVRIYERRAVPLLAATRLGDGGPFSIVGAAR
jgi:protein-export membrane protein SecD